jgi:hypothetical protein
MDKHSSLLQTFINYGRKKSYNIEPSGLYYKTFRIIIYDRNDSTIVEPVL